MNAVLKECNVAIVLYDLSVPNSLNKVKSEVLPFLNDFKNLYAVFIVGNKLDLLDSNNQKIVIENDKAEVERLEEEMNMDLKYFHISCKNYLGISPLFSEMLNSLAYPHNNLLYIKTNDGVKFEESFLKALKRVLRILDKDRKGHITWTEFAKMHESIFEVKLENDHINSIKEFIKIQAPELSTSLDVIDENVFVAINKLSVKLQESQTTWTILRKFGYNDSLELDSFYFNIKKFSSVDLSENILELSSHAIELLTGIFVQNKNEGEVLSNSTQLTNLNSKNHFISKKEWEIIFSTLPYCNEDFTYDKIIGDVKLITVEDWISLWQTFIRIDYEEAYKTFLYLGYDLDFEQFIKKTKKCEVSLMHAINYKTIYIAFLAQNLENLNNFIRNFSNYFTLTSVNDNKQKNFFLKLGNYTIIICYFLISDIEVSFSNNPEALVKSFKKFDLLVFSDYILSNQRLFSYLSFKTPYFIFSSGNSEIKNENSEISTEDEKCDQESILKKILAFAKKP